MKLSRKLKKGKNHVWWTKHQIKDRILLVQCTIDEIEAQGGRATKDCYMEIEWLKERLQRAYRVTKWTRKAEHLPDVAHYIQWRKETKNPPQQ